MANEAKRDEHKPEKMVYARPELKALGSLYEITKGPGFGIADGIGGSPSTGFGPTPS